VTSQAPNVRPKYVANQSNTSHDNRPVAHTGGKDQSSEEAGMDESHDWALRILGPHGPTLRERIPQLVREAHAASVTSQESSGQQSAKTYGLVSTGILERFRCFGEFAGATLISPGGATYWVPVMNHIAIFPWRFADRPGKRMEDTTFSRSRARAELSKLPRQPIQGTLGFDVSRSKPVPISNDPALASKVEGILNHPEVHAGGFVLVAISSSRHELYSVEWGLALPADENRLVW